MVKVWAAEAELKTKMDARRNRTPCLRMEFAVSNAGKSLVFLKSKSNPQMRVKGI
jgi:hypothetical protein